MVFKEWIYYFCIDSLYDLYDRKILRNFFYEILCFNVNIKCIFVVLILEFKLIWVFFDIVVGYFCVVVSVKFFVVIWGRVGVIFFFRFCFVVVCFRVLWLFVLFILVIMYCNLKSKVKIIEIM